MDRACGHPCKPLSDLAAIVEREFQCPGLMCDKDGHHPSCAGWYRAIALRVAVAAARWQAERLAEKTPHLYRQGDGRPVVVISMCLGQANQDRCAALGGACLAIREAGKMEGGE